MSKNENNINENNINENSEENSTTEKKKWTDTFKSVKSENNNEEDLVEKLMEENKSTKEKLLRTLAELENTRRIHEEEKSKTIKYAIANFSKDLINIMENFHLAFNSFEKDNNNESFLNGITLNFNEFKKIFEKNNIKRLYPKGEKFNPDFQEAISQIDSEEETGTVIEVLQAGYTLNDRVIKPALVIIAK